MVSGAVFRGTKTPQGTIIVGLASLALLTIIAGVRASIPRELSTARHGVSTLILVLDVVIDGGTDLEGFAAFQQCFGTSDPTCLSIFDFDATGQSDGVIDQADLGGFARRFKGPNTPPGGGCPIIPQGRRSIRNSNNPPNGTFALHGRPVDVLPDGKVLVFVRARYYDPVNGRWLQRDPKGNIDGPNLYESFGGNAVRNVDPMGTDIWVTSRQTRTTYRGVPVIAVKYSLNRNGGDLGFFLNLADKVMGSGRAVETDALGTFYVPVSDYDRDPTYWDRSFRWTRNNLEDQAITGAEIADLEFGARVGVTAFVALPVAAAVAPVASAMFSTTTVGITTTTVTGNIAAASLTGGVSLAAGSATSEALLGGSSSEIAQAGLEGFVAGGLVSAPFGVLSPVGLSSAASQGVGAAELSVAEVEASGARSNAGNLLPQRLARVIDARFAQSPRLGALGSQDVFVTAADDIAGITTSTRLASQIGRASCRERV